MLCANTNSQLKRHKYQIPTHSTGSLRSQYAIAKIGSCFIYVRKCKCRRQKTGVFAIKPSGVPYDELSPEKMVIVDFEAKMVDGKLRPSSDTKTHAVLYKHWENIRRYIAYAFNLCHCMGAGPDGIFLSTELLMQIIIQLIFPARHP